MKKLKILLIGQPNVGKSSLLNALVGSKSTVSNYPGTTVELTKAIKKIGDTEIEFIDTPGTYSISDRSEEEKVTEKALFGEKVDGVVTVIDVNSLERGLYVVLQILEAKVPTILALNFIEDAKKRGISIDYEKMEKILRTPIVPINPLTKTGINKLVNTLKQIKKYKKNFFTVRYDDHIEKAISKISTRVTGNLPERFVAIRVLENDEDFYEYLEDETIIKEARLNLEEHPKVAEDIAITRYGTASFISEKVTEIISVDKKRNIQEQIDDIFLHKIWGPLITFFSLLIIFGLLLYLGNITQNALLSSADSFLSRLNMENASIINVMLNKTLIGLSAGISIALPYVFLFYLLLGLMEDTGILPRFVINIDRFSRKLGIHGKAFIPMALGLGCTVPAIRGTRVLSSKKEQFLSATLLSFVPCSSRTAIIMGIVGFYGGKELALLIFLTLIFAGLIWALIMKKTVHVERKPLILELPPYRKPLLSNVIAKSWIRMKDFVYIVIPLLIIGGMVYGIFEALNLTNSIVKPLSFITKWLNLPSATIIPLVFGFLQKDLTGGMLISALGKNISAVLNPVQIYIFGVAATIGIPCINAFGMLVREFNIKKAIGLTLISIAYGILLAGIIGKIILVFSLKA